MNTTRSTSFSPTQKVMRRLPFSENEAQAKVGANVCTSDCCPYPPPGTQGVVVGTGRSGKGFKVVVEWDGVMHPLGRAVRDRFSRNEYETFLIKLT